MINHRITHAGDPYCLELRRNDTAVFWAEHGAGTWDFQPAFDLSLPVKVMQMLTTKEPDDDMIEVAIAAVEAVFDWRAFQGLKEEEPLDMPKLESGQTDAPELEELDEIKIEDL